MGKRTRRLLLILTVMVFVLAGCKKEVGSPQDNAIVPEKSEEEERPEYKFGFTCITMENPYFIALEAAVRGEVEAAGSTMIVMDPELDSDTQKEQIQEMIEQGIDAIFLSPVDWETITPVLHMLKEADVKIINIDTQVKEFDLVDAYVGSDNKNAGYICGEKMITDFPQGGKIAILECPTQNSINDRITGFEESIAKAANGFEVVAREDAKGDLTLAKEAFEKIIKDNPELTAVMCGNDPTALGALVAAKAANRGDIKIYSVDGSPDLKKELEKADSQIAGMAAQSPINIGKTAVGVAMDMLNGETYIRETYESVFLISKENLELYGIDGWQ